MYMFCRSLFFSFVPFLLAIVFLLRYTDSDYLFDIIKRFFYACYRQWTSTSGTRRVNLVANSVINHEWRKDQEMLTTSETYMWLFVTHIFHSGQPSHGGHCDADRSASYLDLHLENWQWGAVKNETLRQKRWFQFSHCELSIYM
jgi:hypothetical protein